MSKYLIVNTRGIPEENLAEERAILEPLGAKVVSTPVPANTEDQVIEYCRNADVVLVGQEPITARVMDALPNLIGVVRYGVGVDTVDLVAAAERGIPVAFFPDFCMEEVSNHALMLILALGKKLMPLHNVVLNGDWTNVRERLPLKPMGPIHGETLGLIAFGRIAQALARKAQALGMHVIAYDPYILTERAAEMGVEMRPRMEDVFAESDYISIHLPLTETTRKSISSNCFNVMKPTAYFINTARGKVVDEPALIEALRERRIAGAGLDVFEVEPITRDNPLLEMAKQNYNLILLPHTASYADQTNLRLRQRAGEQTRNLLSGIWPEFVADPACKPGWEERFKAWAEQKSQER